MSLSEYIVSHQPISNLPSLLDLHHSNPLGVHPLVPLCLMLLLAVAMHIILYRVSYRNADRLYPVLYALLGVEVLVAFYYCFMGNLPLFYDSDVKAREISVGWFCQHDIVGYFWSIVGVLLLTYTVSVMANALMQTMAQLSVDAGFTENKPWKEWKWVLGIMLFGMSAATIADSVNPVTGSWILLCTEVLQTLAIIGKAVADGIRMHNAWRGLLFGVVFFLAFQAITMLTIEALEGYIYILLILVFIFSCTKARKKAKK